MSWLEPFAVLIEPLLQHRLCFPASSLGSYSSSNTGSGSADVFLLVLRGAPEPSCEGFRVKDDSALKELTESGVWIAARIRQQAGVQPRVSKEKVKTG